MSHNENTDWYVEQEKQQQYFDELDRYNGRDTIQEELDAEFKKWCDENPEEAIKKGYRFIAAPLKKNIVKNPTGEHSLISEKQRAYNLAKWILSLKRRNAPLRGDESNEKGTS